jgi:hypothetical protein
MRKKLELKKKKLCLENTLKMFNVKTMREKLFPLEEDVIFRILFSITVMAIKRSFNVDLAL